MDSQFSASKNGKSSGILGIGSIVAAVVAANGLLRMERRVCSTLMFRRPSAKYWNGCSRQHCGDGLFAMVPSGTKRIKMRGWRGGGARARDEDFTRSCCRVSQARGSFPSQRFHTALCEAAALLAIAVINSIQKKSCSSDPIPWQPSIPCPCA